MPHRAYRTTLWLLDQTHILVTALTALTFLKTRSVQVGWFIAGAVGVNTFAKILKNIIRQDRPTTAIHPSAELATPEDDTADRPNTRPRPKQKVKRTYGMPSTHSTSIGFYMIYLFLTLPLLNTSTSTSPSSSSTLPTILQGPLGSLANLAQLIWGSAIIYSRVEMGYHTVPQVVVGSALGLIGGWGWNEVWEVGLKGGRWEIRGGEWIRWGFGLVGR